MIGTVAAASIRLQLDLRLCSSRHVAENMQELQFLGRALQRIHFSAGKNMLGIVHDLWKIKSDRLCRSRTRPAWTLSSPACWPPRRRSGPMEGVLYWPRRRASLLYKLRSSGAHGHQLRRYRTASPFGTRTYGGAAARGLCLPRKRKEKAWPSERQRARPKEEVVLDETRVFSPSLLCFFTAVGAVQRPGCAFAKDEVRLPLQRFLSTRGRGGTSG